MGFLQLMIKVIMVKQHSLFIINKIQIHAMLN
jgi:hypothetical protein